MAHKIRNGLKESLTYKNRQYTNRLSSLKNHISSLLTKLSEDELCKENWRLFLKSKGITSDLYFSIKPNVSANIICGEYSYSATAIDLHHFSNASRLEIGKFTSIGRNLKIITNGGHNVKAISTFPFFKNHHFFSTVPNRKLEEKDGPILYGIGKISIGNDVWIGDDVKIIRNISIGNGVVVGAGSVITKPIPSYEIWAGVPAERIGRRFDEEISKELENTKWWELPISDIYNLVDHLKSDNVPDFIERVRIIKNI